MSDEVPTAESAPPDPQELSPVARVQQGLFADPVGADDRALAHEGHQLLELLRQIVGDDCVRTAWCGVPHFWCFMTARVCRIPNCRHERA